MALRDFGGRFSGNHGRDRDCLEVLMMSVKRYTIETEAKS